MKIIAISGKRGAGKDTLANYLVRSGRELFGESTTKCAFADDIKLDIVSKFTCDPDVLWGTNAQKEQLMPGLKVTYREAMRIIGTAYSDIDPNYYIDRFFRRMASLPFVVISDIRFVREVHAVRDIGGKIVRLTRAENPEDIHPTEVELDGWDGFDAVIDNQNLTPGETQREMVSHLRDWGWLKEGSW